VNYDVMALIERKKFGSPTRKQVMHSMAMHINEVHQTDVWPSAVKLGLRCEIDEKTVRRVWKEFAQDGLIKKVGEKSVRGGRVKVWRVNLKAIGALPNALKTLEEELSEPADILSGGETTTGQGVRRPPDTESAGHRTQCPTKSPEEESIDKSIPVREAFDYYNQVAVTAGWPKASVLTDKRKTALKSRLKAFSLDQWKATVDYAATLPWCCGKGGRDWRADIDYLSRESGFLKIFENMPQAPDRDLFNGSGPSAAEWPAELETSFRIYSESGCWIGSRYGHHARPDSPEATYPAALYEKFKIKKGVTA